MSVNTIFEQLKATPSRNGKEAILKQNIKDDVLKEAFRLALDPMTQFYQRKIPEYKPVTKSKLSLEDAFVALGELSSRKITGNAAIDYLRNLLQSVNSSDALVLERIIQKDPDCGVQASTINKIWKNLVHEYPCMLASAYDEKLVAKVKFPAIVQVKMDGMRFNAIVDANAKTVTYRSRNGKYVAINNYLMDSAFLDMAKNVGMANVVFDGELTVVDDAGKLLDRKTGNGILNKAVKGTIKDSEKAHVRATIWDVIPLQQFLEGKCDVDYETRLATVVTAIDHLGGNLAHLVSIVETNFVNSAYEAQVLYQNYYEAGHEGIILKDRNSIWEDKRSKGQIKFKAVLECDLICVGWNEGSGKYKGMLGSVSLESSDGVVKVNSGSGLTEEQCKTLKPSDVIGKVFAIEYNARITNKQGEESLFLPIIVEIREDKTKADASKDIK